MNTINKITVSGNTYGIVDTDTKVTSAANHYTPSADNSAELTASLSGTAGAYAKDTEYTVLTGVKAQRDTKGHVTGLTYTAQKIKDTDTNTWRPVQCNGTDIGSNTLNFKAGDNVNLTRSGGTITIASSYMDTWRPLGTTAGTACEGNDSRLSDARPASDVYTWAKASSKPTYIASEVMSITSLDINSNTSALCSITGTDNGGKAQTNIYRNTSSSDVTVTVPTGYITPDGEPIELTCPAGGYCEVSFLNKFGTIYVRGL